MRHFLSRRNLSIVLLAAVPVMPIAVMADDAVASLPEGIDFYGKVNLSAQMDTDYDSHKVPATSNTDTNFAWHSYTSRLGAKGKYLLNDDWALVYKAEYEIDANNGYGSQKDFFLAREMYAGISSKTFGTLEGGKIDTPLRALQTRVDQFADLTAGDIKFIMVGKNRDSHTYLYRTPSYGGVTATFATINFREVDNGSKFDDGAGNSMSIAYEGGKLLADSDGLYIAIAHDEGVHDLDVTRVAAQYKFGSQEKAGVFTVGALAQNAAKNAPGKTFLSGENRENGYMVNAAWAFTSSDTIKVQYGNSQQVEADGTISTIGYDHRINKDLKVYAYHGELMGDEDRIASDRTLKSTGLGVEFSF